MRCAFLGEFGLFKPENDRKISEVAFLEENASRAKLDLRGPIVKIGEIYDKKKSMQFWRDIYLKK